MKTEIEQVSCIEQKSGTISKYNFFEIKIQMKTLDDIPEGTVISVVENQLKTVNWDQEFLPSLPKTIKELVDCLESAFLELPDDCSEIAITNYLNSHYKEDK